MIVEQLTNIYLNYEYWHKNKLSVEESNKYHERLLMNGNILTFVRSGELIGYLEFWRLDFEQFGRLVCGDPILTDVEDLLSGEIAYINNMYIKEEERNGEVFSMLGAMFLTRNRDANYFCTFRNTKHTKPIKVYKREDLIKLYTKGV